MHLLESCLHLAVHLTKDRKHTIHTYPTWHYVHRLKRDVCSELGVHKDSVDQKKGTRVLRVLSMGVTLAFQSLGVERRIMQEPYNDTTRYHESC
jgi:hypothetical protein